VQLVAYERRPVAILEYDRVWPIVAEYVSNLLAAAVPVASLTHVGSTAVPGLSGKGVIDLMAVLAPSALPAAVQSFLDAGLQTRPNGFPASRPLLFTAVQTPTGVYQVHVHVVPEGNDEVHVQLGLVTALRSDASLREEYAALKRKIVESGDVDPVPYSAAKDEWLAHTLSQLGLPPTPVAFGG